MTNNHSMSHHPKILFALFMAFQASARESQTGIGGLPEELSRKIRQDAGTMATEWGATLEVVSDSEQPGIPLNKLIRKLLHFHGERRTTSESTWMKCAKNAGLRTGRTAA